MDELSLHLRVLENSSEFFMVLDAQGIIRKVGPNVERKLGASKGLLLGRSIQDLLHPQDWLAFEPQFQHITPYPGSVIRLEFRMTTTSGTWLNLDCTLSNGCKQPEVDGILLNCQDITRFKLAEDALRFAEEKYRSIYENAVEGIFQSTLDGRFLSANLSLARILGWETPAALILGVTDIGLDLYLHPHVRQAMLKRMEETGAVRDYLAQFRRRDGAIIWCSINSRRVLGTTNRTLFFEGTMEDVTRRVEFEEALRTSEERYALAALGSNGGLWEWSLPQDRMYLSARWKAILGHADDQIGNTPEEWFDRVHPRDIDLLKTEIQSHLDGKVPHFECEFRMLHRDGGYRWVLSRGRAQVGSDGIPVRMAGSIEDITSRKRAEEQLLQGAIYDSMTGLPNRALFLDRLRRAISRAARSEGAHFVGVLHIDIDRFKIVNDSLGHEAGDEILLTLARAIEECIGSRDTVARFGGDEFGILMEGYADLNVFSRLADRILKRLSVPMHVRGQEVFISVSIGIAVCERLQDNPEELLRDSETAMYRAKTQGKGRYVVYNQGMHDFAASHLEMETSLRRAVDRAEFKVFYQPILELSTGALVGYEALVRWFHPEKGIVSPVAFIPLAEETGLINEIGRWVLWESCRQMMEWRSRYPSSLDHFISVNLSARQFGQTDIVDQIKSVLTETGMPGDVLKLEITESVILDNSAVATEKINGIKDQGIRLSIDDFGTGYSSLSYLHQYPFDTLKVDRSFVMRMAEAPERAAIVRTIVQLARNLGMDAVAEGIETRGQLAGLRAMDCKYGQGFLFSKPVPAVEAEALIGTLFPLPAPAIF